MSKQEPPGLDLGRVIYQTQDDYGELRVLEFRQRRTLCFDVHQEQSASLMSDPAQLVYDYTQAMLLSLLFTRPRRILCLGLGAGSLASALHRHCPAARIQAVELRQSVIDIARRYFALPSGPRMRVQCADAEDFLLAHPSRYELIFSDLCTAKGVAPLQLEPGFLAACAGQLALEGMLVLNCWLDQLSDASFLDSLSIYFSELWCCLTESGNCLLFATNQALERDQTLLRDRAREWSEQLGFSLLPHLSQLLPCTGLTREDLRFLATFQWLRTQ